MEDFSETYKNLTIKTQGKFTKQQIKLINVKLLYFLIYFSSIYSSIKMDNAFLFKHQICSSYRR